MNVMMLYGVCAAAIGALGLYGLIVNPQPLRKILALNVLGSGIFLLFGVIARRGTAAGLGGDPVPQAMIITAIVVAFSATAVAWPVVAGGFLALVLRHWERALPSIPAGDVLILGRAAAHLAEKLGAGMERIDGHLRRWPAASVALLVIAAMLAGAMYMAP